MQIAQLIVLFLGADIEHVILKGIVIGPFNYAESQIILKIKWLFQNFDRVSLGKEWHGKGASCHQIFFLRLKEIIPKESDISLSLKPVFTLFL